MKSKTNTNTIILLVLTTMTFSGLVYILYMVNTDFTGAVNATREKYGAVDYILGLSHLVLIIFHVLVIFYIFTHLRKFSEMRTFKIFLLFGAVISLFCMGVEKVMIDEISREYRHGMGINEFWILNSAYMVNVIFCLLSFIFLLRTLKMIDRLKSDVIHADERIFVTGFCLGIAAGIAGIYFTMHIAQVAGPQILSGRLWVMIPFYIMFLTPFAIAQFYWFIVKRKQDIGNWYDEKQIQDMLKASAVTLVISAPGLALPWLLGIKQMFLVFFYNIFLILLVFSTATLYFFSLKDRIS